MTVRRLYFQFTGRVCRQSTVSPAEANNNNIPLRISGISAWISSLDGFNNETNPFSTASCTS